MGEKSIQLFSLPWPGDDECILPIVKSIVDGTILSIVDAAIAGHPDPSWKIGELWGCRDEPNGDGGLHSRNVTRILDNYTAARWVQAVMKLNNQMLVCIIYRGQQADGISGAQIPMCGG